MSLKYMQGFETIRDDTDFRAQGWTGPAAGTNPVTGVPSVTAVPGESLSILAPYNAASNAADGASVYNPGCLSTGYTVNQAWTAGGFSMSFTGKFNSSTTLRNGIGANLANSSANNGAQCFDGTLYWAIQYNGTNYQIANSPDLMNWTLAASQPVACNALTTICSPSPGLVAVIAPTAVVTGPNTSPVVYYTSNSGASWTAVTSVDPVPSGTTGVATTANIVVGHIEATGNSSFPHVMYYGYNVSNAGFTALLVGDIRTGMTRVATLGGSTGGWTVNGTRIRVINGVLCVLAGYNGNPVMWTATASGAINTTAAWSVVRFTPSTVTVGTDITYHQPSGNWVISLLGTTAYGSGIATALASGGAGAAIAPIGGAASNVLSGFPAITTVSATARTTAGCTVFSNVINSGGTIYAFSAYTSAGTTTTAGAVFVSTDSINYTAQTHILPQGANVLSSLPYEWRSVYSTGTQYVMATDSAVTTANVSVLHSNMIITSPDLSGNYQAVYVSDGTEYQGTTNYGCPGIVVATGQPSAGLFTLSGGSFYFTSVYLGKPGQNTAPAGQRRVYFVTSNTGAETSVFLNATGVNQFEMVARSAPTANQFFLDWYVNGSLQYTSPARQYGSGTSDTTSVLVMQLDRKGGFTAIDDVTFTLRDGQGISGPVGPINIIARRPTTDSQAQWVATGGTGTNASAVNQQALSSASSKFVSSANAGDIDLYTSTTTIPTGYTAKAVQVEGFFTKTSSTIPTVSVGVVSGSGETDSAQVTASTTSATYASVVADKDPNTNGAWTNAAVIASKMKINHVA